jgi:hypothetical protein
LITCILDGCYWELLGECFGEEYFRMSILYKMDSFFFCYWRLSLLFKHELLYFISYISLNHFFEQLFDIFSRTIQQYSD